MPTGAGCDALVVVVQTSSGHLFRACVRMLTIRWTDPGSAAHPERMRRLRRRGRGRRPDHDGSFWVRSRQVGDIRSVTLFGDLDEVTVEALDDELRRFSGEPAGWIVLDLGALCFVDDAGLAYLTDLGTRLRTERTRLTVLNGPAPVRVALDRAGAAEMVSLPTR